MANQKGHTYSDLTRARLYALSGNKCAFPNCSVTFLSWENDTNFSNICHIEDANPNKHRPDRYNANMTEKQRSGYENLILLCPIHHIETNDPIKYPVSALKEMKRNHEIAFYERSANQNIVSKYPSVLTTVVSAIGTKIFADNGLDGTLVAPDPEDKIRFNNVIEYKPIIEAYKVYQGRLNKIYQEIENQGSTRKELVLKNINQLYLREKGKYPTIDDIRANADNILKNIERELWEIVDNSPNKDETLSVESIAMSILIVMVDAFMRCEILEEPITV